MELQATCLSDLGPVGMIDKVVGFGAKLKCGFSIHGELFAHIEIPILEAGPVDLVANSRLQVESACSRLGKDLRSISVGGGYILRRTCAVWIELFKHRRRSVPHDKLPLGGVGSATEAPGLSYPGIIVAGSDSAR